MTSPPPGERPAPSEPTSQKQAPRPLPRGSEERPTASANGPSQLEQLAAVRALLNSAERSCAVLRGADVRDLELVDAASRIREAHGLLWRLSRKIAGEEERNLNAPLTMSIDYVAWVLADRKVDHWTAELLRLMAKADSGHRAQLAQAFPREAAAIDEWSRAPFGDVADWRTDG